MIIRIDPTTTAEIPEGANVTLELETPFTAEELSGATAGFPYKSPAGAVGEFPGVVQGTSIQLEVTPGMMAQGLWRLKPKVTASGRVSKWKRAMAVKVIPDGVSSDQRSGDHAF